jgi:hypothetical protein
MAVALSAAGKENMISPTMDAAAAVKAAGEPPIHRLNVVAANKKHQAP